MGKFLKQKRKPAQKILAIAAVMLLLLAALFALLREPSNGPDTGKVNASEQSKTATQTPTDPDVPAESDAPADPDASAEPEATAAPETEPQNTQSILALPLVLEDGGLVIENLFQYEGMNPDCNLNEGKDIAAITLRNTSGIYLEEAKITLTLTDGTLVNFTVSDLPAGQTVMTFDVANTAAEADAQCTAVSCKVSWNADIIPLPEGVSVSVEDLIITVTNNSGRDLSELVIYCRCPLGEEYFGGIAYSYTINNLPANESTTVEAWDCILGMVEVVRIAEN